MTRTHALFDVVVLTLGKGRALFLGYPREAPYIYLSLDFDEMSVSTLNSV